MLAPVMDAVLAEAEGPFLVDGGCAPPVAGVVVGGRAAEVAGDLALGVGLLTTGVGDALGVGLLTTGVGDEGAGVGAEGAAAEGGFEAADELHWLTGGAVMLQAPGRARA